MIDHILYNGQIVTLDTAHPRVSALAISGERIVAYGSDDEILALAHSGTLKDDLQGRFVIPGLTDAHIHWERTALSLRLVNLFEVHSRELARERVAARAGRTPVGEWIVGQGWTQEVWEDKRFPTAADLDAVTPQHPVYLTAKSGHAAWVNNVALRMCGVDADTPDPEGGQIVRDADGQPTGLFFETAMGLVSQYIPQPGTEELADMMLEAQGLALASGLTGLHDFDDPSSLRALQVLRERGQLALRVVKQINRDWLEHALELGIRQGFGDDWLRFGGLKLFADGALGPRTALMVQPYEGEPDNYGIAVLDKETMHELAGRATMAGLPAVIHAIGDRAVHDVLDVYEDLRRQEAAAGIRPEQRRHRIEHVQIIHPDDKKRLAELHVIASMQPIHATSDYQMADAYWGERCKWAYNPRLQLDEGAIVAFGSDSPIDPFDPIRGLHAAVTRRRADGLPGPQGWYPELRLSMDEALRAYTLGPAYAAGMEGRLGRLGPGYLADMVVLDSDLYEMDPDALLNVQVLATMVGGVWRYGRV